MSRVKIIATLGPRTNSAEAVQALAGAGADVMRLNGSHADAEWHAAAIALVRRVAPDAPIIFDLPGRKIRTRALRHEPRFAIGDRVILTTAEGDGGHARVPVSHPTLHEDLTVGDTILGDDGQFRLTVEAVVGQDLLCRAETPGILRSAKGLNVPGVALRTALVTEDDRQALEFAKAHAVDFVGISFTEHAEHIGVIRRAIGQTAPRLIAKIEHQRALAHLPQIIEASDAVMIDRGDLSVETGLYGVALLQKRIVARARSAGKPAIVATEMLHSMITGPLPTKAEISDITNAVLDGASAIMLSGETAMGRFPVEAVSLMRRVADEASAALQATLDEGHEPAGQDVPQAMEDAIALICRRLPVTKIVAITISGYAARMVAARSPRQPILAVSNDAAAARSFRLLPGTEGVHVDVPFSRMSTDHIPRCLEILWRRGKLVEEDLVLVTSVGYPKSGNRMNLIQTHRISDLRESLHWAAST